MSELHETDLGRLRELVSRKRPLASIYSDFSANCLERENAVSVGLELIFGDWRQPAERALWVLGPRAKRDRNCITGFRFDGRPTALVELVREANDVLRFYDRILIRYPGLPA